MSGGELSVELEGVRKRMHVLVEGKIFVWAITLLILLNSVTLGLETNGHILLKYGSVLRCVDRVVVVVFAVEIVLKLYVYRLSFFRSGWNLFDFTIVSIALIPATGPFSILRALRILRVFRLFSVVPQMRKVVAALLHSLPGMASVAGILALIFYVCAVLTTVLFGQNQSPEMQAWFGSLSASIYTLFQVMTLESWSMGIVRPTMEIFPLAWLFFIPFIVVTSFAVLNLFIGIIVDAMQVAQVDSRDEDKTDIKEFTHREVQLLNRHLTDIQEELLTLKTMVQKGEK